MMNKPDCYKCRHRRAILGDAHTECGHPLAMDVFSLLAAGVKPMVECADGTNEPLISGHKTGIENGWFAWPFNFDPTWLLTCYLFEKLPPNVDKEI